VAQASRLKRRDCLGPFIWRLAAGRLSPLALSILLPAACWLLPADSIFPLLPENFSAINHFSEEDKHGSCHH